VPRPAKQACATENDTICCKGNFRHKLQSVFLQLRQTSNQICAPLEIEDYGIQTMPDVSPPKWHLAHTSWFFETFLLKPFLPSYREFHPLYSQLFNSYYNTIGSYHPRPERGLLSRPTVQQVYAYREHINEHMLQLIEYANEDDWPEVFTRTQLGINHEQQHQELMFTDIKHIFFCNPLRPRYRESSHKSCIPEKLQWIKYEGGAITQGYDAAHSNFCYDNEGPSHKIFLQDFQIASRLVTNQEMMDFIKDGGYQDARLWLSDAWDIACKLGWQAPLYWEQRDDQWWHMTFTGMQTVDPHAPVCHVSFYEADAYARWANKRLPTEQEWEHVARPLPIEGNLREQDILQPTSNSTNHGLTQIYGDVWEWTQSPYTAYSGYRQTAFSDFSSEYNSKFMSNQMVLRGGSCVTPSNHIRPSYRNFFYPANRWQFSGFRLAEDNS